MLSIPNFWFAVMLQILFGLYLTKWFHLSSPFLPVAGITTPGNVGFHLVDRIRHLILPSLVLAVQILAVYSRYMRASMLDVLHSDYLRTARAKGLSERRVIQGLLSACARGRVLCRTRGVSHTTYRHMARQSGVARIARNS